MNKKPNDGVQYAFYDTNWAALQHVRMELHKEKSIEDAVKCRRRATKDESMERVTTVDDAVSGVDDHTQYHLHTETVTCFPSVVIVQKPSTGDDMILGILKTQANQIQALTAVVAQHGQVLELLTSLNVPATCDNKPIMDLNLNLHPFGGVHIYPGDGTLQETVKEVANTRTLPDEALTRQECPPPKLEDVVRGISAPPPTRMARVNKGKAGTPQPAPQVNLQVCSSPNGFYFQRKLSFKDEGESSQDLIRNIRSTGPGSPWTFYTHRSADIRSEETPKVLFMLGSYTKKFKKFYFRDSNTFMEKQCLDLSFCPPPGMQFVGHELAVAAYIFVNGLQPSEILVENEHCTGNREALWTLRPGEEVVDDVINLVVAMFSSNMAEKQRWWLPTTFAQIAMSPGHHCKSTLDYIVAKYMGFVDNLLKIYVPLHMGCHWYLMIVDMWDHNLIYLDSLKSTVERQARIDQILEVADSYVVNSFTIPFFWVAEWMIQYDLWASYDLQKINGHTRMTIAVDLVMGEHNPISEEVQQKAVQFWDRNMICSYMKGARPRKRTRSPVGPLSP
ncbi:Ubiquitin-like-specific protease 1A [Arachis hypogaea]|nr:Ubiquitin-like-specific protease 1A [Arachis hypogaea]